MTTIQSIPVRGLPFLFINGLVASWGSNTTLSVSSGVARDSTDTIDLPIGTAPLNGGTTAAPVTLNFAVTGVNGLDTGSIAASKVYAIYVIGDSAYKNPVATIASLASNSQPLLPTGYDSYRLIAYWASDASSHLLLGYVSGTNSSRLFTYDAPQATAITAGAATSYTAVDLSALVPSVANTPVSVFTALTPSAAGRGVFLQGVASTGDAVVNLGQVTSVVLNSYSTVLAQLASSLAKINYKVSNASDAVAIKVAGFQYFI